jgi:aminocarboxymuconate-semialdehyde decarboxylase
MPGAAKRPGGVTRRDFIASSSLAVAGAAVAADERPVDAQVTQSTNAGRPDAWSTRLIDVHHHHMPPMLADMLKAHQVRGGSAVPPTWSPELSLDRMNQYGFATAMLSISEGVEGPDAAQTRKLCRACNEHAAKLVADHPGRFGMFASLPLPQIDATLQEIEYAFDTLHADGVTMMSHVGEAQYLGDPSFASVYEELHRRKAVVFVHPHTAFYQESNSPLRFPGANIPELPFDTTRAVISMLAEGTTEKFPDITFILSHAGGTIPFLLSRVALLGSRTNGFMSADYQKLAKAMATFYYDLTNTVEPPSVSAVSGLAPASKMLFGTDVPYGDGPRDQGSFIGKMLAALPHVGLSDTELAAVGRGNAEALFPRLKRA